MWSTETTSPLLAPANEKVFSIETREQALSVLEKNHGWLVAAMGAPVRNVIDWLIGKQMNPQIAASVIDARNRFSQAANDATYGNEGQKAA